MFFLLVCNVYDMFDTGCGQSYRATVVFQGQSYRLLFSIYYFLQHKTKSLVCTTKGINPLSGELQLASDLDFYIDGVSAVH